MPMKQEKEGLLGGGGCWMAARIVITQKNMPGAVSPNAYNEALTLNVVVFGVRVLRSN